MGYDRPTSFALNAVSYWWDLNPRPTDYETVALPAELQQHMVQTKVAYFSCTTRLQTLWPVYKPLSGARGIEPHQTISPIPTRLGPGSPRICRLIAVRTYPPFDLVLIVLALPLSSGAICYHIYSWSW